MRRASLRSLAKINLDLRVLHKRPDGFHEIRTVFQTISLADRLVIELQPARRTTITLAGAPGIADNLIVKAAQALCDAARIRAAISFRLTKNIPMGAGLGGGSSNAAAVLLALPVLAGVVIPQTMLLRIAAQLGSDVPFFLHGGAAVGIGRGAELFPLAETPARHGLLVTSPVHVSTADAYRALNRGLTSAPSEPDTSEFQGFVWGLGNRLSAEWTASGANDFEAAVFSLHPELRTVRNRLRHLGAKPALMTGSGSALFGLFDSRQQAVAAASTFGRVRGADQTKCHVFSLVSRGRYQSLWRRQLQEHIAGEQWPPRTRYGNS